MTEGFLPTLTQELSNWSPPLLNKEIEYRDHLLESLRPLLPDDARLEKEYRDRGTTIDLWLKWNGMLLSDEVSMELKLNLTRKDEFDRLVGQIEGLKPKKNKVVVILIGELEPTFLGRLKEQYKDYLDEMAELMSIVHINPSS